MKVCHILSGDLWAGAEVMAFNLLNGLRKCNDVHLTVILLNNGKLAEEIKNSGISLDIIEEKDISVQNIYWKIRKKLLLDTPDIIHSHRYKENLLAYAVSLAPDNHKVLLLGTQHSLPESTWGKVSLKHRSISKINEHVLSSYFQNIVAVSTDIKNVLERNHRFLARKINVIHNGIEMPQEFFPRENIPYFTIGSLGRLVPVKNYAFFVEVARECVKYGDNFRFELGGDGPELQFIEELIGKYNLRSRFTLKGNVVDSANFYRGIDLYMNTSLHEGIPMSVLEAMSYGLPVIAPDVGGFKEIIDDGIQGYLMNGWKPEDYAEKCFTLFLDKRRKSEMGDAARGKVVKDFSCDKMTLNYYNLYREILKVPTVGRLQ